MEWTFRQITILAAAIIAAAALGNPAWAQGVQLGAGAGGAAFVTWLLGPAGLGSLVALFIALTGIALMAGRHTFEGILFVGLGGIIAAAANTIATQFG